MRFRRAPDAVDRHAVEVSHGLPSSLRILLALAAAVVVLAGVSLGRELVGPLALAAVIVIICHPVRHPLERAGWPSWAATTVVILLAYAVIAGMFALLALAAGRFGQLVAESTPELRRLVSDVQAWISSLGLDASVGEGAASVIDPTSLLAAAGSVGSSVIGVLTALFFVLAYVIFMAADGARYAGASVAPVADHRARVQRITRFNSGIRRYYVVNATFGAVVAVIDGLALWALGVPAPLVWAILAFVTNFVPNIGFVLGLIPPAVLALAVGGWQLALVVIALYIVINVTLQVLVQPKFVSDAVDLSLTLTFFSVIFWTFIIGPLGAILAVPLTLLARALILDGDPDQRWLRWLSSSGSSAGSP
ncbi:AI-2E family transporter [Microbacterium sp.]|uniref:AI-2E family transporter n=1 Tax=Microbacterium sp. TaxID=51671 RepID=UPI002896B7CA|nr:AI-2E family transporter [Microbacterium sp.]